MEIKFDKDSLAVEQNSYTTKIGNVSIAYDLDAWSRNPTNNIKLNSELWMIYSSYGITFDSADSWNFDNDFARHVVISGSSDSWSSHADTRKNNFLILPPFTKYLRQTLVFMWNGSLREKFNFYFSGVFG